MQKSMTAWKKHPKRYDINLVKAYDINSVRNTSSSAMYASGRGAPKDRRMSLSSPALLTEPPETAHEMLFPAAARAG